MKIKSLHIKTPKSTGARRSTRTGGDRKPGEERPQRLYSLLLPPTPPPRDR